MGVVEQLRFVPSSVARSMITRRTHTVGALLPDLHGEYFSELIRGIDLAARARGLHLLVSSSHGDAVEAAAALRAMKGRVDGLLVMSPHASADFLWGNLADDLPAVLMNTRVAGGAHSSFAVDNHAGAYAMVQHFVAARPSPRRLHRRPGKQLRAQERLRGYREAMAALLPGSFEQVLQGDFTQESGFRAGNHVVALTERPTAIFASNDMMAIGCLSALNEAGLPVPHDIALAGFDDIPISRYVNPPLTTVRAPHLRARRPGAREPGLGHRGTGAHADPAPDAARRPGDSPVDRGTRRTEIPAAPAARHVKRTDRATREPQSPKPRRRGPMRQVHRFQLRALAAAAMLALAVPAMAQLSSATVRGAVTADAKAQPGATVVATNTATGQTTRTTSRADGSYVLVNLVPGTYKIDITAEGFAPARRDVDRGDRPDGRPRPDAGQDRRDAARYGADHRLGGPRSQDLRGRHQRQPEADRSAAADHAQLPRLRRPGAGRALRRRQRRQREGAKRRAEPGQHQHLHRRRQPEEQHPARRRRRAGLDARQPVPAVGDRRVQGHLAELQGGVRPGQQRRDHGRDEVGQQRAARRGVHRSHRRRPHGLQPEPEGEQGERLRSRRLHAGPVRLHARWADRAEQGALVHVVRRQGHRLGPQCRPRRHQPAGAQRRVGGELLSAAGLASDLVQGELGVRQDRRRPQRQPADRADGARAARKGPHPGGLQQERARQRPAPHQRRDAPRLQARMDDRQVPERGARRLRALRVEPEFRQQESGDQVLHFAQQREHRRGRDHQHRGFARRPGQEAEGHPAAGRPDLHGDRRPHDQDGRQGQVHELRPAGRRSAASTCFRS